MKVETMKNIDQQKMGIGFGLLILVFGISMATPAMSQNARSRGDARDMLGDRQIERMQEVLELSDSQIEQIKQLQESQSDVRSERTAQQREVAKARRAEATQQRTEAREAFEAILTSEQLEKMSDLKQREIRGQRAKNGRRAALVQNRAVRGRQAVRDVRTARRFLRSDRGSRIQERRQNGRMNSTGRGGRMWNQNRNASADGSGFVLRGLRGLELTDEQQTRVEELTSTLQSDSNEWRKANTDATTEQKQEFRSTQDEALEEGLASILTDEQLATMNDRKSGMPAKSGRRENR